ncbi:type VI secretion system Vgr family protein [Cupriavidus sp. 30B13]|uniref:type VI secretion system Vgr family protein n=1 Tax=Cupriavidus sp. 30B13 TaxID=3384241 RepID=UPI003B8F34B1
MPSQSDLRFTFAVIGGVDFEVIEFDLQEALSETFRLDVQLAHANPDLDFDRILDQPALLTIWHGERPVRHVHGRISTFQQGDTGFRRTRYRAVVDPTLARLRLGSDWRLFQTRSVPEILQSVLGDYGITDYEQVITNTHLPREYCVQAGETDFQFVQRIATEEGLFHRFAFTADGHRLIHGDRLYIHGAIEGGPVRYQPNPGGDQPEPALRRFTYTEHVRTARQTQRDYTFTHPRYRQEHTQVGCALGGQDDRYEHYGYPGRYKKDEAGRPFTENRLLGHRRDARMAVVEGDDPRLVPGVAFDLVDHPREDLNHGWRPVRMHHHGVQHTSQAEESAGAQQGTHYRYTAEIIPDRIEWRPEPLERPVIAGPQVATVVGPEGEEIYVDEHGRVKVQFPWDRQGREDEHSSCWIRVASNWAGARWGHIAIPRIGQEVIVDYLDGDPDQPLITSRAFRSTHPTPYALPRHNILSVIKSKEHKGQRASELRIDDTTKEISAALINDHGASALHLGYLTHPRPDGGAPRGEGFELRTDEHGALRAAKGLLLSTEAQPEAGGGHLDRREVVSLLETALQVAKGLGDYAGEHQGVAHDAKPRRQLTEAVRDLGHGANDEANGAGEGGQPVIALSAPAGIAAGTPRSIALGAGEHLDGAAQQNVQLSAGERVVINAGTGLGTFAQSGDMRHIAHQGELLLQAQHNTIRVEADQSVEIAASDEHVQISADEHITLLCGGAYIRMQGGNIELGMPGKFTAKAAKHTLTGPASMSVTQLKWSTVNYKKAFPFSV